MQQRSVYKVSLMKKQIDIKIVDWWDSVDEINFKNEPLIQTLQKHLGYKYDFKWSNNPKYLIYSVFGDSHLDFNKSCIRICYVGEHICTDWNLADYGIDLDMMDFEDRHLYYPLYFLYQSDLKLAIKKHLLDDKRENFCGFMVSNGSGDKIRGEFFEQLSEYKKVDSGGRYKNNIGGAFIKDKNAWLQNYKFNLCFENSSQKGYVTEKLIQAFAAGCVPIYWGDESLCDERYAHLRPVFNPKAFINVHNFDSIESAIKEIERIDNNDSAFEAMRKEPIFRTECLEEFLGEKFANGGGQKGNTNDIWSAEHIEQTTQAIIDKGEKMLSEFYDNIFTKGTKQIKYGQRLNAYFSQRQSERIALMRTIRVKNALWKIRHIAIAPLKWIRALWRKIAWRFLKS